MEIQFTVNDLPPKKDGANSMWRKGPEVPRLKALRVEALRAMGGAPTLAQDVELQIRLYADPSLGDLDNFIAGICDGLMAAHPIVRIDDKVWADIPSEAHPQNPIVFSDDAVVCKIVAERRRPPGSAPWYEIQVRGE